MESLSYNFDGRGPPLTDDTELYMDDLMRSRNLSKGWDLFDGMGFIEPGMTRKSFVSTQYPENLVNDANGDSSKSATETNDEKLAQSDFKNKKILASRKSKDNRISVENSNSVPAKRARITNLQSQVPVCIVHGCNKDLSSSKEYHKRHKVCDVHSKTPVVIVNGIQQRFCQKCSRFHLLAEFDEGKRSCRKRLMGHNERRRKPKWHNPFGSKFFGTDLSRTSSIFSKILPGDILDQQCYDPTNYVNQVKLEDDIPAPRIPKFLHDEMEKQYPSKNCLNSPLSVLELSAGSNPSCALSLLSAQSPSLLNNYAAISFQDFIQNPTRSTPENFILNTFSSSSGEVDQRVPDARACLGVGTTENEVSQETSGLKHSNPSREGAKTVDLVQLSLHLQKVEQQKYSAQY